MSDHEYLKELTKDIGFTDNKSNHIDTINSKEKAIYDLDVMITDANNVVTGTYKSSNQFTTEAKALFAAIQLGQIHGVKWVGK